MWCSGSGVLLDSIDSLSLPSYLLLSPLGPGTMVNSLAYLLTIPPAASLEVGQPVQGTLILVDNRGYSVV